MWMDRGGPGANGKLRSNPVPPSDTSRARAQRDSWPSLTTTRARVSSRHVTRADNRRLAAGVAPAVVALVVVAHGPEQRRLVEQRCQQALTQGRVLADAAVLGGGEGTRLVEEAYGQVEFADVVQARRQAQGAALAPAHAEGG